MLAASIIVAVDVAHFMMNMADVSTIEFDRALKFSLTERGTPDLKLKTKQLEALRAVVQQKRDLLAVLPTGYGKSLFNISTSTEYV